jgi:hypothetical protein
MSAWRTVPNFQLYEINRSGTVKQVLDGRMLMTSKNNHGEHYHLEGKSGRVTAIKKSELIDWAFPKETE